MPSFGFEAIIENMAPEKKKTELPRDLSLTGEDIDMLHERETDPQGSDYSGDYSYKNHMDGA